MNPTFGAYGWSWPSLSSAAKAVSPSSHSTPRGLFFSASTLVSRGPVLSSTSLTGMPVAALNALVTGWSYPCAE